MLIEEQIAVVAEDLDQLYDDQFIETCAHWVIPYIGDLIGYQSVQGHRRRDRQPARRGRPHDLVCAAAREPCSCSSSSPATSPAGARMRSSSSACSATRST